MQIQGEVESVREKRGRERGEGERLGDDEM